MTLSCVVAAGCVGKKSLMFHQKLLFNMHWILSAGCGSGLHCGPCRRNREFRESLARREWVPHAEFACPYGIDGNEPMEIPTPSIVTAPNLGTKALRLWRELRRWRKAGYQLASRKVQQERLAHCEACVFYEPKGNWGLGQCRICGCTRAKLWLASAQCPHPEGSQWENGNGKPEAGRTVAISRQ